MKEKTLNEILEKQIRENVSDPETFRRNYLPFLKSISELYDQQSMGADPKAPDNANAEAFKNMQAERLLREQKELDLKEAQSIAKLGTWETDLRSGNTYWSDQIFAILDLNKDEAVPSLDLFLSMIHPEDKERVKAIVYGGQQSKKDYHFSARIISARGKEKFIQSKSKLILDADGELLRAHGTLHDKTESNQMKEKLIKSEQLYKVMASNITDSVICMLDTDYRYILVEGDMLEKLGYSIEKLLGHKMQDVLLPEVFKGAEPDLKRMFGGEYFVKESRRGDYDLLTRYIPLKDDRGEVYSALLVTIDITALKKTERALSELNKELESKVERRTLELQENLRRLSESEEKFQKTFQASAAAISITNLRDAKYLDVNNAFLELTGFELEEVIGYTSSDLRLITDIERREEVLTQINETGRIKDAEMTIRNKQGVYKEILVSIETIQLGGDKYAINIIYDITERKRTLQQIEAVNKELSSFTYSVSHDLRAPLRAVHGYTKILFEEYHSKLDDEGKRLINKVLENTKKMGQLIDELLAFSKLGKTDLHVQNLSMQELLDNLILEFYHPEEREINFVIKELHPAMADRITIRQVWYNLISNAVKYTRKVDRPVIEIGSEFKQDEVVYYIKDNGAGFNMEYSNKLFGVFQRLHSDADFEGNGVGLAIVHKIISKHNGRIWAEGKEGEGAIFYFSLRKV